jgi:mono/diheme cytochrome c family protein
VVNVKLRLLASILMPIVIPITLALLATLSSVSAARGQEATPTPLPESAPAPATPSVDRLAPPPTVASPTQADEGAQLFWLHCQPCHGDQGQGLTDEWRMQYPEEDRNCWTSGCHGRVPYEEGFTLPTVVPAVIGDDSLARFATMGDVYDYVRVAMPFPFPGTLTEAEYLAITAYLARAHGVWDGRPLDPARAHQLRLLPLRTATVEPGDALANQPASLTPTPTTAAVSPAQPGPAVATWTAVVLIALLLVGGVGLWMRNR